MEMTFEMVRVKLQKHYDDWIKPMIPIMSPVQLEHLDQMIEEYSLTK